MPSAEGTGKEIEENIKGSKLDKLGDKIAEAEEAGKKLREFAVPHMVTASKDLQQLPPLRQNMVWIRPTPW